MIGLASRFSAQSRQDESLAFAVTQIERELEQKEMDPGNISLNDIKLTCLCVIHQLASGPDRSTWTIIEKLSRVVRDCKLDQVDGCPEAISRFPESSLEELRYVWWTVVKIDASCNILSGNPFSLNVETATTSLITTSVSEFTAGVNSGSLPLHVPRSSQESFWSLLEDASNAKMADGQRLQLCMVLLLREGGAHLRGITQNSMDPALEAKMLMTHNKCMRVCAVLPSWYMDPKLAMEMDETLMQHRNRLEALVQLRMYCLPALSRGSWKANGVPDAAFAQSSHR